MKNPIRNAMVAASSLLMVTAVAPVLMAQTAPAAQPAPAAQTAPPAQAAPAAQPAPAAAPAAQADPFTITLPAGFSAFAKQAQTVKTPDGKDETITNWVSKAPTGEAVVVTVSKMPGKILDPQATMTTTRDSVIKSLKAEVESDDKLTGDLPAEQVVFHSGTAAYLKARLAVKDDSLYQVLYVGRSTDQRNAPTVDQLFNSFKINDATTTATAAPAAPPATQTTASTSH